MIWSALVAAYLTFNPVVCMFLFFGGSLLQCLVLLVPVLHILYSAPNPIVDRFYSLASKMFVASPCLVLASIIYCIFGLLFFSPSPFLPILQQMARPYIFGGPIVCLLITLLLGITYKDPHWVVLKHTTFSPQKVRIEQDSTIRFANPASGVTQRLCLASAYGPEQLREPGAVIAPGHVLHVTFPSPGDYEVIGVGNPALALHIKVYYWQSQSTWHEPGE